MKLALVYSLKDNKLQQNSYTSIFKDEFNALQSRFEDVQLVNDNCHADDISADLIFFFDPHATHHVKIDGIRNHKAMKMELWNDVHQNELIGTHRTTGIKVHKLGQAQRAARTISREINHVIVAAKYLFLELFEDKFDDIENLMIYHPHAPSIPSATKQIIDRKRAVLGNGATSPEHLYKFRNWAFKQHFIDFVPHWLTDKTTPSGAGYVSWMSGWAGAFTGTICPVPKYSEIAAAGCVPFLQYQKEWEEAGFKHHESCIYVRKANIEKEVGDFLAHPEEYQAIADNAYKTIHKYSADRFADMVYEKARGHIDRITPELVPELISKPQLIKVDLPPRITVEPKFKNVFVLNPGRCGSVTFSKACEHIWNYTTGHETLAREVGDARMNYPDNHIEIDNRLSWFLGALDKKYGKDAMYVYLKRDLEDVAKSHQKRLAMPRSFISAYKYSIIMNIGEKYTDEEICKHYCDTVEDNIRCFLKDKPNMMEITIGMDGQFRRFWDKIRAEGSLNSALEQFKYRYNASRTN